MPTWSWKRPFFSFLTRSQLVNLSRAGHRAGWQLLFVLLIYAALVSVPPFRTTSVSGFSLVVGLYAQFYSGFLLALFYPPDPSFVITTREDLMREVRWFAYVYKMHVIGVDILFVLSYLHILKKFYLKNYLKGDPDGWFTGAYAFLVYHLVVFLGITLSTNHSGDVTIMIAANIFRSLFLCWHKVYAPFLSNKHLSVDQLTRFMIAHYLSAWYYLYLVQTHIVFVHEMWDAESKQSTQQSSNTPKGTWGWDALIKEILSMFALYKVLGLFFLLLAHPDTKVINFSYFEQWSETEMEEINFFIVGPHWYFRPHMGLLTVCAHHYEGLAWLISFYASLCYVPHIYRWWAAIWVDGVTSVEPVPMRRSPIQELIYVSFFGSLLYVGGTLPCGRFYYENVDGFFGNFFLRASHEFIYLYLFFLAHAMDILERKFLNSIKNQSSNLGGESHTGAVKSEKTEISASVSSGQACAVAESEDVQEDVIPAADTAAPMTLRERLKPANVGRYLYASASQWILSYFGYTSFGALWGAVIRFIAGAPARPIVRHSLTVWERDPISAEFVRTLAKKRISK